MTRVIVMLPCADIDEVADRLFRETVPEPAPSPMPPPHERILDAEFLAELDERLRPGAVGLLGPTLEGRDTWRPHPDTRRRRP